MAKSRTYFVSFTPAAKTEWGTYQVKLSEVGSAATQRFTCLFDQVEGEVRNMAKTFGLPCSAYLRLPKGERNPPGFDALARKLHIIDVEG